MAQIPSGLLVVLLGHKGGTAYGLLESGWVILSVPETIVFLHTLITKLIDYYLKLKLSNF